MSAVNTKREMHAWAKCKHGQNANMDEMQTWAKCMCMHGPAQF